MNIYYISETALHVIKFNLLSYKSYEKGFSPIYQLGLKKKLSTVIAYFPQFQLLEVNYGPNILNGKFQK